MHAGISQAILTLFSGCYPVIPAFIAGTHPSVPFEPWVPGTSPGMTPEGWLEIGS